MLNWSQITSCHHASLTAEITSSPLLKGLMLETLLSQACLTFTLPGLLTSRLCVFSVLFWFGMFSPSPLKQNAVFNFNGCPTTLVADHTGVWGIRFRLFNVLFSEVRTMRNSVFFLLQVI